MVYCFDSSAIVAHALDLAGSKEVEALLQNGSNDIFFSVISLFELAGVLKQNGVSDKISAYWQIYRECASVISANAEIVQAAWLLRDSVGHRIPLGDAIIAATAQSCEAILVHRDQHLAQIPTTLIPQIRLPG